MRINRRSKSYRVNIRSLLSGNLPRRTNVYYKSVLKGNEKFSFFNFEFENVLILQRYTVFVSVRKNI